MAATVEASSNVGKSLELDIFVVALGRKFSSRKIETGANGSREEEIAYHRLRREQTLSSALVSIWPNRFQNADGATEILLRPRGSATDLQHDLATSFFVSHGEVDYTTCSYQVVLTGKRLGMEAAMPSSLAVQRRR